MKYSLILVILLAACGFTPQQVPLAPQVNLPRENIGGGRAVAVQVADARSPAQKALAGLWGKPDKNAPVTIAGDPAAAIGAATAQGLQQKGFTVSPSGAPLTVELRQLAYANDYTLWTIGLHATCALHAKVGVYGSAAVTYEHDYAAALEKRSMIAPSAERNAEWLNRACGDAISQLLSDPALLRALSGK